MENISIYSAENPIPLKLFDSLFSLMEQSFPPSERRSKLEHYAEFSIPNFRSLCYCPDGLAGFMNYWDFGEFVFLEHFAVSSELRGHGLGASLMGELKTLVNSRPIVLEAEPAETGSTAARRAKFYTRLGFYVNDYEYFQPPISEGEPPVRLNLLSYPSPLSERDFLRIRGVLYKDAYKVGENRKTV